MVCQEKKFNKKTIKGYGSAATQNIGKKRDPQKMNTLACE
jgi:hypothetical protein